MLPCRYGANCTRQNTCNFAHPTSSPSSSSSSFNNHADVMREPILCKFGAACTKPSCTYYHPSEAHCAYGSKCTNSQCTLLHPEEEICWNDRCTGPDCLLQHRSKNTPTTNTAIMNKYNNNTEYNNHSSSSFYDLPSSSSSSSSSSSNNNKHNSPALSSMYPEQKQASSLSIEKDSRLCRFGDKCTNVNCLFSHPIDLWERAGGERSERGGGERNERGDRGGGERNDLSTKLCRYGERCLDMKCPFMHSSPFLGPETVTTTTNTNRLLQPLPLKPKGCKYGAACTDPHCTLLHLSDDPLPLCPNGDACSDPDCAEMHPDGSDSMPCIDGAQCNDPSCTLLHPSPKQLYNNSNNSNSTNSTNSTNSGSERGGGGLSGMRETFIPPPQEPKQCRWGTNCSDPRCTYSHVVKPKQPKPCRYGAQCTDSKCAFFHAEDKDESSRPMPRHNRYVATLEFIFQDCNLACDMRLRRLIERGNGGQPGDLDDDIQEPDDEVHWKLDNNNNMIRNNWREGGWVYLPSLLSWHPDTQNLEMDIRAVAMKLKHKTDAMIEVSNDLEWIRRKGNRMLPPKRPWKWREGYRAEDSIDSFSVASWNLQADMTRTNSDGTNRSLLALGKRQILQGLGMPPQLTSPSICCLQELQTMGLTAEAGPGSKYDHASGMVKLLEAQGYGGRLYPSMKNTIGIFWKNSEFDWEEDHTLSYSISYKGAIFVLLRHLATRRRVMVATTHLSVPVDKYSKFIGFKPLLEITECLKEILALRKQWSDENGNMPPLILAGDFNSEADSSVYELLTKGEVSSDNADVGIAKAYGLKVDIPLVNPPLVCASTLAEILGKEPDYTNVNKEMDFVATLDYIMHVGLRVEGTLDVFPIQPKALPNEQIPSDHMPLCSLFTFPPLSPTTTTTATPSDITTTTAANITSLSSPRKDPMTPNAVIIASANKRTYTLPSPTQTSLRQRESNSRNSNEMLLPVNSDSALPSSHSSPLPSPTNASTAGGMSRSSSLGSMDGTLESPVRLSKRLQKLIAMKDQDRDQQQQQQQQQVQQQIQELRIHTPQSQHQDDSSVGRRSSTSSNSNSNSSSSSNSSSNSQYARRRSNSYDAPPPNVSMNYYDTSTHNKERRNNNAERGGLVYENYHSSFYDEPQKTPPRLPLPSTRLSISSSPSKREKMNNNNNRNSPNKPIQRLVQLRPDISPHNSPTKQRRESNSQPPPHMESVRILKAPTASERTVLNTMRMENENGIEGGFNNMLGRQKYHENEQIIEVPRHKEESKRENYEHNNNNNGSASGRRARRSFDETDKRDRPKIIVVDGQPKQERRDSTKDLWKGDNKKYSTSSTSSSPAGENVRTLVVKPSPSLTSERERERAERPVLPRPASAQAHTQTTDNIVRIVRTEGRPVLPKPRSASSSPSMSSMSALTPPFTSSPLSRSWSPKVSALSSSSPSFTSHATTTATTPTKAKPATTVRTLKPQLTAK